MSLPADLAFASVRELAEAIRERRAAAREVLDAHLVRIDRLEPALGAVTRRDDERARRRAREADDALARGESWGPLHGVPFTLKEQHDVAGWVSSLGFREGARTVLHDGVVVERLVAAGGVLMGKTNMAMNVQGLSPLLGRVVNPWDPARVAGGSSGGAAAAVAARLTPFDVGGDATGSIRMPSHFCGVWGLRPTIGRVPSVGMGLEMPGVPGVGLGLGTAGPIARTAADLQFLMGILSGAHPRDPGAPPVPFAAAPPIEPRALRLAFLPAIPGVPCARAVRHALSGAATRLADAGVRIDAERALPVSFAEILSAFRALYRPMVAALGRSGMAPPGTPESIDPGSGIDLMAALDARDRIVQKLEEWLGDRDALLCPASIATAFPLGALGSPVDVDGEPVPSTVVDHPCVLATLTGSPALVVPIGRDPLGLPVGAQLVGRRWDEPRLLAAGAAVGTVVGALPPPPLATGERS